MNAAMNQPSILTLRLGQSDQASQVREQDLNLRPSGYESAYSDFPPALSISRNLPYQYVIIDFFDPPLTNAL